MSSGLTIQFRVLRQLRPRGVDMRAFPSLLSATWVYTPNEYELPAAEEMELMDEFEDALVSALEGLHKAHLMVILTGSGERDWLWYTRSEEEAMCLVDQALKRRKRYPVDFSVQNDRGWKAYSQFVSGNATTSKASGLIETLRCVVAKVFGR